MPVQSPSICCLLCAPRRQRARRRGSERGRRKAAEAQVTSRLHRAREGRAAAARGEGSSSFGAGFGLPLLFLLFAHMLPDSKMPTFFVEARRVSLLEPAPSCALSSSSACSPGCRSRDTRGHRSQGCVCTLLCPALAPRCPQGLSGLCKGEGSAVPPYTSTHCPGVQEQNYFVCSVPRLCLRGSLSCAIYSYSLGQCPWPSSLSCRGSCKKLWLCSAIAREGSLQK